MAFFKDMLGNQLLEKDDKKVTTESICGRKGVVGLYFSAHWCPPCRGFTPKLAEFYEAFKTNHSDKPLEIVFVSSDKDGDSFKEYFAEMPFLALPFEEREKKSKLSKMFKIQGIPSLVFLDAETGELLTRNGREKVMDDPEGLEYPWRQKSLAEIFAVEPGTVIGKDDQTEPISDVIKDKVVGLYFSAHWCPPCKAFTPILTDVYNKVKGDGKKFEIFFISSDRTEEAFNDYYKTMPWCAIPYGDRRKKLLSEHFDIQGIPALVILDENLEIIQKNGRGVVSGDKEGKDFPWRPKPLNKLSGDNVGAINETPALIYLCGDGKQKEAYELCYPIAESYCKEYKENVKSGKGDIEELFFAYEDDEESDTTESLKTFLNLPDRDGLVLILDIPAGKKYVLPEGEVTKERLQQLVDDFKNKKLNFEPMR